MAKVMKTSAGLELAYAISNHIYEKGKEALKNLIETNKRLAAENKKPDTECDENVITN